MIHIKTISILVILPLLEVFHNMFSCSMGRPSNPKSIFKKSDIPLYVILVFKVQYINASYAYYDRFDKGLFFFVVFLNRLNHDINIFLFYTNVYDKRNIIRRQTNVRVESMFVETRVSWIHKDKI